MGVVYTLIFLLSFPFLIAGMLRPNIFSRFRIHGRREISFIFAAVLVLSFIGVRVTRDVLVRVAPTDMLIGVNSARTSGRRFAMIQDIRPDIVRLDVFSWDLIEWERGTYDFSITDEAVESLLAADIPILGIIQYSPPWASGRTFEKPENIVSDCGLPAVFTQGFHVERPAPPIDPDEFGRFAGKVAQRYPEIQYWQIWNEPNNPTFWNQSPDADEYAQLLKASYREIKKANPRAQVVLGGISLNDLDYLDALYSAGVKDSFDALAVHLYNPAQSPDQYLHNELVKIEAFLQKKKERKSIWLTEIGWHTSSAQHGITETQQADYIRQLFAIVSDHSSIGAVIWHTLSDCTTEFDQSSPEHNYGLFNSDLTPKRSAGMFHQLLTQ